jgi:23S rRNA pseudouridine1911/1915/1917 synthase
MDQEEVVGGRVPRQRAGERLDKVLDVWLPDMGLRARRRLIRSGHVRVTGGTAVPAFKVPEGMLVEVRLPGRVNAPVPPGLREVARSEEYAALFKPAGLHTQALSGGGGVSVEDFLPGLWPGARLVNRLDVLTTGLVLARLDGSEAGVRQYRELEDRGLVTKTYLAVVHGRVAGEFVVHRELDVDDRSRVRLLEQGAGKLRQTWANPLAEDPASGLCLLEVVIRKGARHQIRAHLAHAGHPILGDDLYGAKKANGLYLHHGMVELPGFAARAEPEWPDWQVWKVRAWGSQAGPGAGRLNPEGPGRNHCP